LPAEIVLDATHHVLADIEVVGTDLQNQVACIVRWRLVDQVGPGDQAQVGGRFPAFEIAKCGRGEPKGDRQVGAVVAVSKAELAGLGTPLVELGVKLGFNKLAQSVNRTEGAGFVRFGEAQGCNQDVLRRTIRDARLDANFRHASLLSSTRTEEILNLYRYLAFGPVA
jgi:hypothetical protein